MPELTDLENMTLFELFAAADAIPDYRTEAEKQVAQWEAEYDIDSDPFAEMNGVENPFAEFLSCPLAE